MFIFGFSEKFPLKFLTGMPIRQLPVRNLKNGFVHRVAGWFVFKPKIPIWVNFGGP
jgi:hypothetical protein